MRKRFAKPMKKWKHGLFGSSVTVMGSVLAIFAYVWIAIMAGAIIYLQITCARIVAECDMYDMQGCDTTYSEVVVAQFQIRCSCEVDWCPGQAGIPEDLRLAGGAQTVGAQPRTS